VEIAAGYVCKLGILLSCIFVKKAFIVVRATSFAHLSFLVTVEIVNYVEFYSLYGGEVEGMFLRWICSQI
jgi:hypothetical protein